ncbi:MAG TPA: Gfo/Idh/MocA family oxidoreductase [Methanocella sp.]|jgi:predicted dehydrogenase
MLKSIMIVGCGSIGQRHARNARKIGIRDIILCDLDMDRLKKFAKEIDTDLLFASYQEAVEKYPDVEAAVIATPSGLHIQPAMFLAGHGIHLFVEKPLSSNLSGIDDLIELADRKRIVAMMGQSYRFHEGFLELKKLLDSEVLGKIQHVSYSGGQYLPDWHPDMDYRKEYAAQRRLGGGVILTSMSHSYDTVQWLFGDITRQVAWKSKLSDLEIDVEDSVFCLLMTDRGIIVQCEADFTLRENRHLMSIACERGQIDADFVAQTIRIWTIDDRKPRTITCGFEGNRRYVDELRHFAGLVEGGIVRHDLDLSTGKKIMKLMLSDDIDEVGK